MRRLACCSVSLAALVVAPRCSNPAAPLPEVRREFAGVEVVTIRQAQGWTRVEPASADRVSVEYAYSYPDVCYEPGLTQTGAVLEIGGIFDPVACSGRDEIVLRVPDNIRIEYTGAQSDLTIESVALEVVTYSDFGSTVARNLTCTGSSELRANSGDVLVTLGQSPAHDLVVGTNTGRAWLNYGGHPVFGRFEFTAHETAGTILSPYPFDSVESFDCHCEPGVTMFARKTFVRGSGQPFVRISAGRGIAELTLQ